MDIKKHLKRLYAQEGGFSDYLTFMIVLPILLAVIVGGSYVAESIRIMGTLNHALTIVDSNMTQDGSLTSNGQTQLVSYLQNNGLNLSKVYLNATTTTQSYGSRGLQATMGYDLDLKAPGTPQVIWHKYYQASVPMAQSQFIPNSGADTSGSVQLSSVFTGVEGGTDSGGSGSGGGPISEATSMTMQASNTTPWVNAPVIISGKVYFGSNPAPSGTQVRLSGGGVQQTVSTDSTGSYTASVTFTQAGTIQFQGASGAATASVSLNVKVNSPGTIQLQLPTSVQVGEPFIIGGTVLDNAGNAVVDGTSVTISSSDTTDIPSQTVTTQNGNFTDSVNAITSLNSVTITATAGTASATQNVSVIPGDPKTISLNLSSTSLVAGSTMTFSGQVLGSYGTPPAQGTPVTLQSGTDTVDTIPKTVTDANGNFTVSATLTQAGGQAFYAQTTGPIDSATATATVTAGNPYKVNGVTGTPNPVNAGANLAIAGYVSDQYGNPVASGTTLEIASSALTSPVSTSVLSGAFNAKVTLQAPGLQTLTLEDSSGNPLAGGSLSVTVLATAAYSLTPSQEQYSVTAGQSVSDVVFTLKDSNGQPVVGKTIQFSETPQGSTLLTPASAVTDASGQVQTTVGPFTAVGTQTLMATLAGDTSVVGTVGITVSPGTPSELIANVAPSTTQVWTAQNPVPLPIVSGTVTDADGNPMNGATVTVSGGYGASASTTTDANGYYAIPITPTNLGGPYPLSFAVTSSSGNLNTTTGSITVVKTSAGATLKLVLSNGTPVFNANAWSYFQASVVDSSGNPIQGVQISFTSSAGGNISWNPQWGTTDPYGNVWQWIAFNSNALGNQTITGTATVNGQTLSAQLNVLVTASAFANVIWSTVSPTTLQAGNPMTVSGQALDVGGNPLKNTQITLYLKEGGATAQTVTTDGNGLFSATLTPMIVGTKTIMAQIGNNAVQCPTTITVNPGPPVSGTLNFSYTAPLLTNDTFTVVVNLKDVGGNNVPNYPVTINATSPTGAFYNPATYHPATCSDGSTPQWNWWTGTEYCNTGTLSPAYDTYPFPTTVYTDANGNTSVTMQTSTTNSGTIQVTATAGTLNLSNSLYVTQAIPISGNITNLIYTGWDTATIDFNTYDQKGRLITAQGTMSGTAGVWETWGMADYDLYTDGQMIDYSYYSYGQQYKSTPQPVNSGVINIQLQGNACSQWSGNGGSTMGLVNGADIKYVYGAVSLSQSFVWGCNST